MDQSEFEKFAEEYRFKEAGEICLNSDDKLRFEGLTKNAESGFVYLWIEVYESVYTVVYVGMAGKTLRLRCSAHTQGFRRSSSGKKNAALLRQGINDGKRYFLYARKSERMTLLEEKDIPSETIEERAFMKKLKPTWNRAK